MPTAAPPPEAVIVAGGFGTRMLPLTRNRPKHLLEVGGVPFLEHQIAKLAAVGVAHVVLATSYRAELFRPVLGDGERFGVRLSYVTEDAPLGTAGAIRNVSEALDPDPDRAVVILNGDVLSGHDLQAQLDGFHTARDGVPVEVSLHLVRVPDARIFGCVPTDGSGRVTGFVEKSDHPVTDQVNAGCYVFRRRVVDAIPAGRVVSVERVTFPALVEAGALVVGHLETAYWRDVGTPEALVGASADVVTGQAPTPAIGPGEEGVRVSPGASVEGKVENGTLVLDGACVRRGARVSGSVLMAGATVEEDAVVTDSVVGPRGRVGRGAELAGVTVGDDGVVPAGACPPPGTRVECGATWA
ncbi:MAG: mannose-phosphate guanylyltransferase [Nocardioidaceae bacterium]|nr:mannose-phosphate guanylyltransferase [Nocardioidaceae bacterium]